MMNGPVTLGRGAQERALGVSPPSVAGVDSATESHFTPQELAEAWKLDTSTVRRIFQDEPGVLKIGNNSGHRKRAYCTLRIPASVARRVHAERSR